MLCTHANLKFI
ncbi:uncharacterized protein CELE_C09E10.3 [Caenorhabditis elegans]|uniref:Uncharacterized protein n=1 Tax=Caenorhabditis elegans TaxID=6239 RepID=A0A2K5ATZ0_CAEEL|nr:Uncharacterized protein CELE_C09E10.3 [Caenorhabditis elegans]SPC48652.1 Uncharacterized protein CELE_C09E10.3 [Caenorhabditis elegans]|eukprot:NP_001348791.1 Uncharacterized protein CELE_C09E10.3 [Caenorhabditis elegans]